MNTQEKQKLNEKLQPILDKKKEEALKMLGHNFQNIQEILKELAKKEKLSA
jgi:Holliday junction resolvasome RuvABC DNA-binding subunit